MSTNSITYYYGVDDSSDQTTCSDEADNGHVDDHNIDGSYDDDDPNEIDCESSFYDVPASSNVQICRRKVMPQMVQINEHESKSTRHRKRWHNPHSVQYCYNLAAVNMCVDDNRDGPSTSQSAQSAQSTHSHRTVIRHLPHAPNEPKRSVLLIELDQNKQTISKLNAANIDSIYDDAADDYDDNDDGDDDDHDENDDYEEEIYFDKRFTPEKHSLLVAHNKHSHSFV